MRLLTLGTLARDSGSVEPAREMWAESLEILQALKDPRAAQVAAQMADLQPELA